MSTRPIRPGPVPSARPWLMPGIVTLPIVMVVVGAVWAALLGRLL